MLVDTETSNWTFDPIRRQFFWLRFFSHQPDLNFENPKVHEAMYDIVRFWMDMGIDGFRLVAERTARWESLTVHELVGADHFLGGHHREVGDRD